MIISNSRNARLLVDVIQNETTMGEGQTQNYSGFVSAKVTSIVPGTLFQARMTDPEADPEDDSDSEMELAAPSSTVVTQNGDVICTFTVRSLNRATKPEEFVHLMRPMLASNVKMLKNKGLMWNSLRTADSLSDAIFDMVTALDATPCP